MGKRSSVIALYLCLLSASTLFAQPNRLGVPIVSNYPHELTKGSEQNWCITQDDRGVIYVGNNDKGILESIVPEGDYTVEDVIAVLKTDDSQKKDLFLMHRWPIRVQRPTLSRLAMDIPLITGQRVIDTLFPVAKGGTVAIPGGFGTAGNPFQGFLNLGRISFRLYLF